ncbi:MAG: transposase [Candidatus Humimicrobiaceae bacterium]
MAIPTEAVARAGVLSLYYKNAVNKKGAVPAAICSIQTFGDMLGFNPHLHILAADGGFSDNGTFYAAYGGERQMYEGNIDILPLEYTLRKLPAIL